VVNANAARGTRAESIAQTSRREKGRENEQAAITATTMSEEATINPDGSQTFPDADPTAGAGDAGADAGEDMSDDIPEEEITGIDPAIYLALAALAFILIFVVLRMRRKRANADVDDFFSNLDGEKVSHYLLCSCWCCFV
jgi:hypothetical protein